MQYLQFCPVAKAAEILGEKWTLLIIRELIMGGRRFNDFQRGMATISPTMLSKRLSELCEHGLIIRKKYPASAATNTSSPSEVKNWRPSSSRSASGECAVPGARSPMRNWMWNC